MTAALDRTFSSLRVRNYRLYFAGQVVSISGNWMQIVAEMWLIVQLTGSGAAVGITAGLQCLPLLLLGSWGGVLADRLDKRRLLTITQTCMAVPAITLWALTAGGHVETWMVFALVLVRGSVLAFDNPARQAFVSEIVGRDRVMNAVALNSVVVHTSRIIGPAIAGGLIALIGVSACFALNAATFLVMLAMLRLMDPARLQRAERAPRAPGQVRAALAYVRTHAGAARPAGDDDARRHALVQLPGPAAAARVADLARDRRDLRDAHRGDGRRLGARRARRRARADGSRRACSSAAPRCSAPPSCSRRSPPRSPCRRSRWSRSAPRASRSPPASTRRCRSPPSPRCAGA